MPLIDCWASLAHYRDHLLPIWLELDRRGLAGEFFTAKTELGGMQITGRQAQRTDRPMMTASYSDAVKWQSRPVIYVEHGAGQTYCLAPETRVLTKNLEWTPIGNLKLADELVGFEENPTDRSWRAWRPATVISTRHLRLPCYRLHMADGSSVVASADHRWLTRDRQSYEWTQTKNLQDAARWPQRSSKMLKGFDVWQEDRSWGAGYLAAAFDGEGCLNQTRREDRQNRLVLTFSQRDNEMAHQVVKELADRGFVPSVRGGRGTHGNVFSTTILGGSREVIRFLGSIRPRRLLANMLPLVNGQMRGQPVELLSMEFIGEQEVVGLGTSTGTFFAEGFASHNSTDRDSQGLSGYSGGDRLENVALFIGPSQVVADRWLARYPGCMAVAVGVPKMDRWHQQIPSARGPLTSEVTKPTVAITFHHDVAVIPETRWARPHYQDRFGELRDAVEGRGWRLLGHGHPREARAMAEFYGHHGVQWVPDLATVFDIASLLIADNTSALPEFCSLGRPVIWLNAPWYRREVEHGSRFWDWPKGQVMVDDMDQLLASLDRAMEDPPEVRAARQTMVESVYLACDGKAATRAVDAIEVLFS